MRCETNVLPASSPGTRYELTILRFGASGSGPKAYIQAGIHADEAPGMIVAHHLRARLAELDAQKRIHGEIVLVPMANPIGLSQRQFGAHHGRFHLGTGVNFNRDYPHLTDAVAARVRENLTSDREVNRQMVRAALSEAAATARATTSVEHLKRLLLSLAINADTVLDLHCDGEAVVHLYTAPTQADAFRPLAGLLGACAFLLADVSGGNPFDEAVSRPWVELAARFPDRPIPMGCISSTVELRGQADVNHSDARADADAIIGFLAHRGHLRSVRIDLPPPTCQPTPLEGCEALTAPVPGLIVYAANLGAPVVEGTLIAEIIDPVTGVVTPVRATTSGIFFARSGVRIAEAGMRLGKIAGAVPLRSGDLLSP